MTTAPSGLSLVHTCTTCGASVIELSGNMPAFVHDTTIYKVVVDMNPAVLKAHLALLKRKSGRSTPELLELAREGGQLVLFNDRAIKIHYELRELANAGCLVHIGPPYPHDPQT
jgi:hypothetical protein